MKTVIRGFLTTLLIAIFTILATTIYVDKTINEDILGTYLKDSISSQLTDNIEEQYPELTGEEYEQLEKTIENNESLNSFIEKYTDQIMNDMTGEDVNPEDVDLKEDIKQLLLENKEYVEQATGVEISDEEYEAAIDEAFDREDPNIVYSQIIKDTKQTLSEDDKNIIKGYQFITSNQFIVILSIAAVVVTLLIALLKKPYYKWIVNLGIAGFVSGILISIIGVGITLMINMIINTNEITFSISSVPMLITAAIMIVVSIVLFILNAVLDNHKEKKNAIS